MQTVLAWDSYNAEAARSANVELPVGQDFAPASAPANTTSEASIPQPRPETETAQPPSSESEEEVPRQGVFVEADSDEDVVMGSGGAAGGPRVAGEQASSSGGASSGGPRIAEASPPGDVGSGGPRVAGVDVATDQPSGSGGPRVAEAVSGSVPDVSYMGSEPVDVPPVPAPTTPPRTYSDIMRSSAASVPKFKEFPKAPRRIGTAVPSPPKGHGLLRPPPVPAKPARPKAASSGIGVEQKPKQGKAKPPPVPGRPPPVEEDAPATRSKAKPPPGCQRRAGANHS